MKSELRKHHKTTIENLVNEYQDDERFLAIIIGGSVAKGCARSDSDVDFMIVATDSEFEQRRNRNDFFINRTDLCDYHGGYVDGKIIDYQYLLQVAEKGNEPSRAAFDGAFIAYSRIQNLDHLLERIPVYPVSHQSDRIFSFYCMSFMQNWMMGEAIRHNNFYTASRAANQLVLFAGRLILAYNQVLFPYHKWFLEYINKCKLKPEGFIDKMELLLKEPSLKNANNLLRSLQEFSAWGITDLEAYTWFMKNVEWSWRDENTPLEDL